MAMIIAVVVWQLCCARVKASLLTCIRRNRVPGSQLEARDLNCHTYTSLAMLVSMIP